MKGPLQEPHVRVRAWIAWDDSATVGPGRAALLEAIGRLGSITKAAQELHVSYRTAWKWIRMLNRAAGGPLVEAAPGGVGGGGARLTALGKAVLEAHRRLAEEVVLFVERANRVVQTALGGRG